MKVLTHQSVFLFTPNLLYFSTNIFAFLIVFSPCEEWISLLFLRPSNFRSGTMKKFILTIALFSSAAVFSTHPGVNAAPSAPALSAIGQAEPAVELVQARRRSVRRRSSTRRVRRGVNVHRRDVRRTRQTRVRRSNAAGSRAVRGTRIHRRSSTRSRSVTRTRVRRSGPARSRSVARTRRPTSHRKGSSLGKIVGAVTKPVAGFSKALAGLGK